MPDLKGSDGPVLGFDTSAAHCAAAVVQDGRVLAERVEPMARGQAERLFPLLEELLAAAGIGWRDLSAIGVGTGPVNFTGIRIAVAAARGLSLGLGVPAIGVTATEAAAFDLPRPCRVVVPLRGDEVVWEDFGRGGDEADRARSGADHPGAESASSEASDHPVAPAHPLAPDNRTALGAGPHIARIVDLPPGPPLLAPRWPLAVAIAHIAAQRAAYPRPRPAPVYLRPADAAPPRDRAPSLLP